MTQSAPQGHPTPDSSRAPETLGAVRWENLLEFIHLFKSFRLAINPAKVFVGVLAILAIWVSGKAFDAAWGPQTYPLEIEVYRNERPQYLQWSRENQWTRRGESLERLLQDEALYQGAGAQRPSLEEVRYLREHPSAAYRKLRSLYQAKFHREIAKSAEERKQLDTSGGSRFSVLGARRLTPGEMEREERRRAGNRLLGEMQELEAVVGGGIFETFAAFERRQFDTLIENTLTLVRLSPLRQTMGGGRVADPWGGDEQALSTGLVPRNPRNLSRSDTVLGCLYNMAVTAPRWLFAGTGPMQWEAKRPAIEDRNPASSGFLAQRFWPGVATYGYRGLYLLSLVVLLAFWLAVIATAGGIICRFSALEFAGRDAPTLPRAAGFVRERFWEFFKAPLLPLAILLVLAAALVVLGLVGAIPSVGEILLGAGFIVLLAVAFVMMLAVLGLVGGVNLLYPTMAVEGSDAFDALSRSFAYVYARPWRLVAYSVISLVYGVITFLFVALAIHIILALTHACAGLGTNFFGYNHGWYSGTPKMDTLWPAPLAFQTAAPTNWWAMSWTEWLGARMLSFWVWLVMAALGGYVISFYFSNQTILYYLLRRSVDGQGLGELQEAAAGEPPAPAKSAE